MKNHAVVLLELIKAHGFHTMVEIGVCRGDCAKVILEGTSLPYNFRYYGVDLYQPYPEYENDVNAKPARITSNYNKCQVNLGPFIKSKRAVLFTLAAHIAYRKFFKKSIGLVFIDGNHSYEYVKSDLELYYNCIKSYGIMAVHDYCGHPDFPGVKQATDEFVLKHKLTLKNIGDVYYFYKEP